MEYEHDCSRSIFKRCPLCGKIWHTRELFLNDRTLHLNGYQFNPHINDKLVRKIISIFSYNVNNDDKGNQKENRLTRLSQLPIPGFLIFTHNIANCGTTIIIPPKSFQDKKKAELHTM